MTAIDDLLSIQITQGTVAATPTDTSLPLIVGKTNPGWTNSDAVRLYDSAASLEADGYASSSPEYQFASLLTGQSVVPSQFLVAPSTGALADTLTAVTAQNPNWYCLLTPGASDSDIEAAAAAVQPQKKIYIAETATAAIGDASDTANVAATLKSESYDRTSVIFSPSNAGQGISAAWAGLNLPQTVGSNNWAYNVLAGVKGDVLTAAQRAACIGHPVTGTAGNNANVYLDLLNGPKTLMGTMASGQYIDITVGIDWLFFNIQASLLSVLSSGKVPFSNRGTALLVAAVRNVLTEAATNGLVNSEDQAIVVSAADVTTVPAAQRAGRRGPTIFFSCLLSGAINSVAVRGTVNI